MAGASSSLLAGVLLKTGIWMMAVCLTGLVQCSPYRSKHKGRDAPQLVYDQKQTGDYNIQLHLKDFQIIALLGDDDLSDYDYSYDYADFTVKPSTSKPTTAPPSSTSSSTTLSNSNVLSTPTTSSAPVVDSTNKTSNTINNSHPYPIEIVPDSTNIPDQNSTNTISNTNSTVESPLPANSPNASPDALPMTYAALQTQLPLAQLDPLLPGKIKVQIVEVPSPPLAEPSLGIVPGEDVHAEMGDAILQGEISSYRRCGNGYTRDKKGRCRRVRKPGIVGSQLPFGLGNIANSLATRLRLPLHDNVAKTSENLDN